MPQIFCGNDAVINVVTTTNTVTTQVPVLDAEGNPVLDAEGNPQTQAQDEQVTSRERQPVEGKRVTHFGINLNYATAAEIPSDEVEDLLDEYFITITSKTGLWRAMSDAKAPSWVSGDWPDLVQKLAGFYGCGTDVLPGYLTDGGDLT